MRLAFNRDVVPAYESDSNETRNSYDQWVGSALGRARAFGLPRGSEVKET